MFAFYGHLFLRACFHTTDNLCIYLERFGDGNQRTMVGVGAVGQPRDEDPRACAILFNTENGKLNLLRVKYNITAAQQRIIENGLPTFLAERLAKGI